MSLNYVMTPTQININFVNGTDISTMTVMSTDDEFHLIRMYLVTTPNPDEDGIKKILRDVTFTVDPYDWLEENFYNTNAVPISEEFTDRVKTCIFFAYFDSDNIFQIKYIDNNREGYMLPRVMVDKFVDIAGNEKAFRALRNFAEKMYRNPSARSVEQLMGFLESNSFPITSSGNFLALKNVRRIESGALVDIKTGTINNSVGKTPHVPRNKVSDNPDDTCSFGLHYCGHTYLTSYRAADRDNVIIVVEVSPDTVVSIPSDHNAAKARGTDYTVVQEIDPKEIPNFIRTKLAETGDMFEYVFTSDFMSPEESDAYTVGYIDGTRDSDERKVSSYFEKSYQYKAYLRGVEKGEQEAEEKRQKERREEEQDSKNAGSLLFDEHLQYLFDPWEDDENADDDDEEEEDNAPEKNKGVLRNNPVIGYLMDWEDEDEDEDDGDYALNNDPWDAPWDDPDEEDDEAEENR